MTAETIRLSHDVADDFQEWKAHATLEGHTYTKTDTPETLVEDRRWASIRRIIWERDDGTFWAFDFEHSNTEEHEQWSYTGPELKRVERRETVTVSWELAQ